MAVVHPDTPFGHINTPIGTPFHFAQLMFLLLRETFRQFPEGNPFKYDEDFTSSKIAFDTVFNKDSVIQNKKPYIIVQRGSIGANPVVLADKAAENQSGTIGKYTTNAQSSVMFKIVTGVPLMTDVLGNEVFNFLVVSREILPRQAANSLVVTGLSLSEVMKYEAGEALYYSIATMTYQMQYQWNKTISREMLNSLGLILTSKTGPSTREIDLGESEAP